MRKSVNAICNKRLVRSLFFVLCFLLLSPLFSFSQTNTGFESGLTSWSTTGAKGNISVDSVNQQSGKYCARIHGNSGIAQRVAVDPLSILQFDFSVKSSAEKASAYSYITFYDSHDRELLMYKGASISSQKFEKTGYYTEAPPYTSYALMGVRQDSSSGIAFVDDFTIELNIGKPLAQHTPLCNIDEYMKPFWKSDTIYNETVLMYAEKDQPGNGKLLFTPAKILSVKSFDLQTIFHNGDDYTISGNVIGRSLNSRMPFRADSSFDQKNLAWYNLQSQWIVVTYVHKDKWNDETPHYKADQLPYTLSRLKAKQPLKIVAYGMSITRGLDVSSYDTVAPYMPAYIDLFTRELQKKYEYRNITVFNAGLPGSTAKWGADYAAIYVGKLNPDLVILDFGMNDFWSTAPDEFEKDIREMISKIKATGSNTEFLLLSNMDFDPEYIQDTDRNKPFYVRNMQGYKKVLKSLEATGIINLDMTTISDIIYQKKKAKDCIVNPLHPNDYLARWYAQCMAALF